MNTYEMIIKIYNETKDRYIRENIEALVVLMDFSSTFVSRIDCIDRKTLMNLFRTFENVFDYRAYHYNALYDECKIAFYEYMNDTLLIVSDFYYDIDCKSIRRKEKIKSEYRKLIKASYNIDAYINQYINFYSNI